MLRGMTRSLRAQECRACGEYPGVGAFCDACGVLSSHPESGDYAAPYLRRLAGELIDLGIFVLLPVWLFWMWQSANDGQSPAKSLLNMYVIHESGQPITAQRMWVRELLIKRLVLGLIGYAFTLLGPIVNAGWILLNPDRQCVHDRVVGTLVVVRRDVPARVRSPERSVDAPSVRLPPPAPHGPPVPTPNRRAPQPSASPRRVESEPAPARRAAELSSPELIELEQRRTSLSQTEYERQRRAILRRLETDEGQDESG